MTEDTRSATRRRKPCPHCRSIRDMLKPTMDSKGADSIVVMFAGKVVERIYANAKKGAK